VFAGRRRTGWVVGLAEQPSTEAERVRPLALVQGERSWFDPDDLRLYRWVADRYCAPLASVLRHALPARVAAVEAEATRWAAPGAATVATSPPCPTTAWRPYNASALLQAVTRGAGGAFWWRALPGDDRAAMTADLVARCLAAGRSALVLAPDPASPLPAAALALVAPDAGVDLRDASPRVRYRGFLRCRTGHARVAVGERAAVFAPLRDLGLIVVDDEANPAYKERRTPRHHAREVALARARLAGGVCVLLGELASAQAWRHLEAGHVAAVLPDRATERERAPRVEVADLSDARPGARRARLSERAAGALSTAVRAGAAAVVLASRGGQGSALVCRGCGRRHRCPVCDGGLRYDGDEGFACATCGWTAPAGPCEHCGATEPSPLAAGAARLATELARSHPAAEVVRMEGFDAPGPSTRPAIGVLTRGSVVTRPAWLGDDHAHVVVIPDADALLGRPTLDAAEDALRLWLAAGRWTSTLVLQTREPAHPAVQALVRWDPDGFWRREAPRRAELSYPPATSLVRLVAPPADAAAVAAELRAALPADDTVLGPDPDGALLVKSPALRGTLDALTPLRHVWAKADRKVRVDVDPVES
jgi:primosomal protein N' (replication factor Y)